MFLKREIGRDRAGEWSGLCYTLSPDQTRLLIKHSGGDAHLMIEHLTF
jgi:hypothetical protein